MTFNSTFLNIKDPISKSFKLLKVQFHAVNGMNDAHFDFYQGRRVYL